MLTNMPYSSHAWTAPGDYTLVLRAYNESQPGGTSTTFTIHVLAQPVHYVAPGNTNPVAPYLSWATAATNIQDAVDAATVPGALVLITNGIYSTGGRALYYAHTLVAADKPLMLQSVNGPLYTTIDGGRTNQCAYLTNGATLSGFTLTNGGGYFNGGAVLGGALSNCTLIGNLAQSGGAAFGSTLNNCTLIGNSALSGGGACNSTLINCVLTGNSSFFSGAGAYGCTLTNCTLSTNSATGIGYYFDRFGGGAFGCTLDHCTLIANYADSGVAGASSCALNNCTLAAHSGTSASSSSLNSCTLTGNSRGADTSTLTNCTISGNFGQGAFNSTLSHCVLTGNSGIGAQGGTLINSLLSSNINGGAYSSTLINCAVTGNSGGGANGCALTNCTVTGNSGVGAQGGTLNNCIVYFNLGGNSTASNVNYCCTTPLPTNGAGNISSDPQLATAWRLSAGSPCRGAGNAAYATGTDLDGEPWANPPSIGCDEHYAGSLTGPLTVAITAPYTNVVIGFALQLTGWIDGRAASNTWDFGDGVTATNQPVTSHAWTALGDYAVILRAYNESYPGGISATVTVHVVTGVHYVAAGSTNPVAPFTSWGTAAPSIQEAINTAEPGASQVLVTNGIYGPIYVPAAMTVRSINGAQFTTINGGGGTRCASLGTGASLSGFTLSNGYATGYAGGAYGGTLNNCTLTGNVAEASLTSSSYCASYDPFYHFCRLIGTRYSAGDAYGGGAAYCTLNNCTLSGNTAQAPLYYGYDYYSGTTYSAGNAFGGGAAFCTLNNCTVGDNRAQTSLREFNYGTLDNKRASMAARWAAVECTVAR
jgi:hypothetical protein